MQPQTAPIGYWIKQADVALTNGINEMQFSIGLTRIDWQALHSIFENGSMTSIDLANLLNGFADSNSVSATLNKFKEGNLLQEKAETFMLTEKGIAIHKAGLEKQFALRQKAMANISEQEYEVTIATLKKIAQNLTQ